MKSISGVLFAAIATFGATALIAPTLLESNVATPAQTVAELIALARA